MGKLQPVPRDDVHFQPVLSVLAVGVRTADRDLVGGLRGEVKHGVRGGGSTRGSVMSVDPVILIVGVK